MRVRSVALAALAALVAVVASASSAQASVQRTSDRCAQPDGRVSASVIAFGRLFIGGDFTHVVDRTGSQARSGLAAIDLSTCDLVPGWKADTGGGAGGAVNALSVIDNTIYAGGAFTSIGGQSRGHLAAVDATSGAVLSSFHPSTDKLVKALTTNGVTLYAGGLFTKVDGVSRAKLAAFSPTTGSLTGWNPRAAGSVFALTASADGQRIYVGGAFPSLGGDTSHAYIGAVDPSAGSLDRTFNPVFEADGGFPILALAADSRGVYAGGGGHGGHLVIWNPEGSLQRAIYQTDGGVQAVAVDGDSLYAGGHFANYCIGNTGAGSPFLCDKPLPRRKLFEVSLGSGALTSWAPTLNSPHGVFTESVDPGSHDLYVGGDFTTVSGAKQAHLAVFRAA
jgi:hypothetical protein